MKYTLLTFALFCLSQISFATSFYKCSSPESIYHNKTNNRIYVSCIEGAGNKKDQVGKISVFSKNLKLIKESWVEGLNAPKGMGSYQGYLWVTDIDQVYKIIVATGEIVRTIDVKGAIFLNDIAVNDKGVVYISDTLGSRIYQIINDKVSIFASGSNLDSPNGLLIQGDKLIVASWGLTKDWSTEKLGGLYTLDINKKKITFITKVPLGNMDGLEAIGKNGFIVSDWVAGKVYKINLNGKTSLLYQGKKGLADIAYLQDQKLLLAPMMLDHELLGIKL